MKNLLLGSSVVAALMAGPAIAADMPVKAPRTPLAAPYNWTGFYVGGHFGYGWAHNDFFDTVGQITTASFTAEGILGGVQVGFNRQNGPWVLGVELEGTLSHLQRGVQFGCGFSGLGGFGGGFGGFGGLGGFGGGGCGGVICTFGPSCFGQIGARIEQFGLLSGRFGYAFDRWLAFIKGGGAVAHDKYVLNVPGV